MNISVTLNFSIHEYSLSLCAFQTVGDLSLLSNMAASFQGNCSILFALHSCSRLSAPQNISLHPAAFPAVFRRQITLLTIYEELELLESITLRFLAITLAFFKKSTPYSTWRLLGKIWHMDTISLCFASSLKF